jgi:NitT/TauT family transport system substrate-binding protein
MKKIIILILSVALAFTLGCQEDNKEAVEISVYGLNGPTSMGMIKMFEEDKIINDYINVEYTNVSQPDIVVGKLLAGEVDIAAVPTNVAAMIYNKTEGKYKVAAVNTLGVLYIVTAEGVEINDLEDLRGQTIYASGLASVPEYVLNHVLESSGLIIGEDVFVEYKQSHQELATGIISKELEIALLPQPFVTMVTMESEAKIAISMQELWQSLESSDLAMGCILVKTSLVESSPDLVDAFLEKYEASVDWVLKNPDQASILIESYGVLPKAKIAENAIPFSNIVFMKDEEMVEQMENVLKIFFDFNPKSIGGAIPDDGFYYKK